MKLAKSYKIILFITAVALAFALFIGGMSLRSETVVHAASSPSAYFKLDGGTLSFEKSEKDANDQVVKMASMVATVKNGDVLEFNNKLVISDMGMQFEMPQGVTATFDFEGEAYYVNGNKKVVDGKTTFEKVINNEVKVTAGASEYSYLLNGKNQTTVAGEKFVLTLGVENGFVKANAVTETDAYYQLKEVDEKATAKIKVTFSGIADGETKEFRLYYVDQKASDANGAYKQTFDTDANGNITATALPRVAVNDTFYSRDVNGVYTANKKVNTASPTPYSFSYTIYSLTGGVYSSDLKLKGADSEVWFNEAQKLFRFKDIGTATEKTVNIEIFKGEGADEKVLETISVNVYKKDADTEAPKYNSADTVAIEGFKYQLEQAYTKDGKSIALGTEVEIPSMRDLVYDEYTSYDDMTKTVYYKSRSTSGTATNMEFKVATDGDYEFFVAFADGNGNEMKETDFYKIDETDSNKVIDGIYVDFVQKFHIKDDATIIVEPAPSQGKGFKGIKYLASSFDVNADGCKVTYTLYYNANLTADIEAEGWVEIPKASTITDKNYDKNGYTYDEIKAIAYDGTCTFVPTELGSYKIVCKATSESTSRYDEAATIIRVESEPKTVNPNKGKWAQENKGALIFLPIGGACLIAIIVLLFIKPKDAKEEE